MPLAYASASIPRDRFGPLHRREADAEEVIMTLAVGVGYGIAIWIATAALIWVSSVARLPAVARSTARRTPNAES
jgi:hypothetical protein